MNKRNDWNALLEMANEEIGKDGYEIVVRNDEDGYYFVDIKHGDDISWFAMNFVEEELSDCINDAWANVRRKIRDNEEIHTKKNFYDEYEEIRKKEIGRLYYELEKLGGHYEWDEDSDDCPPICCVGTNYYVGDVTVKSVEIKNGHIIIKATEHPESYNEFTLEPRDFMYGHLSYIWDYLPKS